MNYKKNTYNIINKSLVLMALSSLSTFALSNNQQTSNLSNNNITNTNNIIIEIGKTIPINTNDNYLIEFTDYRYLFIDRNQPLFKSKNILVDNDRVIKEIQQSSFKDYSSLADCVADLEKFKKTIEFKYKYSLEEKSHNKNLDPSANFIINNSNYKNTNTNTISKTSSTSKNNTNPTLSAKDINNQKLQQVIDKVKDKTSNEDFDSKKIIMSNTINNLQYYIHEIDNILTNPFLNGSYRIQSAYNQKFDEKHDVRILSCNKVNNSFVLTDIEKADIIEVIVLNKKIENREITKKNKNVIADNIQSVAIGNNIKDYIHTTVKNNLENIHHIKQIKNGTPINKDEKLMVKSYNDGDIFTVFTEKKFNNFNQCLQNIKQTISNNKLSPNELNYSYSDNEEKVFLKFLQVDERLSITQELELNCSKTSNNEFTIFKNIIL